MSCSMLVLTYLLTVGLQNPKHWMPTRTHLLNLGSSGKRSNQFHQLLKFKKLLSRVGFKRAYCTLVNRLNFDIVFFWKIKTKNLAIRTFYSVSKFVCRRIYRNRHSFSSILFHHIWRDTACLKFSLIHNIKNIGCRPNIITVCILYGD